jgi:hypothetical protein
VRKAPPEVTAMTARRYRNGWRWPGLVASAALAYLALLIGAPSASAHHADISAAISCDGRVVFTAVAWQTASVPARANSAVAISYSVDQHSFVRLPQKPNYAFDPADRFSFTDSFQLAAPLPRRVVIAAQAIDHWGDGTPAGPEHRTAALAVPPCRTTTPARPSTAAAEAPDSSSPTAASTPGAAPALQPRSAAESRSATPTGVIVGGAAACAALLAAGAWALRRVLRG